MFIIIFGKPLAFWIGIAALLSLSLQIYLGMRMVKGRPELLKYHKINAGFLVSIVIIHAILVLALYL
jgi:hypothetical protein